MKLKLVLSLFLILPGILLAQVKVNTTKFNRKNEATFSASGNLLRFKWPSEDKRIA
ncbi:MAG: hypothetical protein WKF66_11300 [Pedobacter sp.]